MKHLKKLLFTAVLAAALTASAFAASGFEFILNVPLGMGFNFAGTYTAEQKIIDERITTSLYSGSAGIGFDTGISAQLGYMWHITDNFGMSLLGEIGYSFDTFNAHYKLKRVDIGGINNSPIETEGDFGKSSVYAHSFKIGILPKFNIKAFSIGIGLGALVPVNAYINLGGGEGASSVFEPPALFYAKLTFDYSIFFTEKTALNIGLYTGVDLIGNLILEDSRSRKSYIALGSFDAGVQLGFRFGPKAFN